MIDSGPTDGSTGLIRRVPPRHFALLQPHEYNPARVVTHGLAFAHADYVICLNADATPQNHSRLHEWPHALRIRWRQRRARLAGFADGWRSFRACGRAAPAPPTWARPDAARLPHRATLP